MQELCYLSKITFRLSTLWHFIAYIDVDAEKQLAEKATRDRNVMTEKIKQERNQEAEDAEGAEEEDASDVSFHVSPSLCVLKLIALVSEFLLKITWFKDDWNQGDEEDEFADAVVETEEHASMRASRASANVVPATGLKPSDGEFFSKILVN